MRHAYRWVVLAAFMAVNLTIQLLWISYAPVSTVARDYYGVSAAAIGAFAMTFMVVYLPVTFPASWLIDHRGLRVAVGAGALLAGVSGLLRGLAGPHYALALLATVGAAVAQPFLLNAWTTLAAHWFPRSQRATAVSLITLANLVGTGLGMALTPTLVERLTIGQVQLWYGAAALAAAVAFVLLARDRPRTQPEPTRPPEVHALMTAGARHALTVRPFVAYLAMVFVGMGVFNGFSTWVEEIVAPRGFSSRDAGNVGALLLLGGILGAVIISTLSDRSRRRTPFLAAALGVAGPALLWTSLAGSLTGLYLGAFVLGFFLTSALPVGMQYAAEITAPTPPGTSNGLIQLAGQTSVVFVLLMELVRTPSGSFVPSLAVLAGLLLAGALLATRLPEPAVHLAFDDVVADPGLPHPVHEPEDKT